MRILFILGGVAVKVSSILEAEKMLNEAEKLNPGAWVSHSRVAGKCARIIASKCSDMDNDSAYVMGLLHDIGRRFRGCDLKHVLDGYTYMKDLGYDDCAQICLTHSFPVQNILAFSGKNELREDETMQLIQLLNACEYNDYDRLIQLCDCLAYPSGPCVVEKRLVDVIIRRGFNDLTIEKWKAFLELRDYFSKKIGVSIYSLFDDLIL